MKVLKLVLIVCLFNLMISQSDDHLTKKDIPMSDENINHSNHESSQINISDKQQIVEQQNVHITNTTELYFDADSEKISFLYLVPSIISGPLGERQDVNIYVSLGSKPVAVDNNDFACIDTFERTCIINTSGKKTIANILVKCQDDCDFTLRAVYDKSIKLEFTENDQSNLIEIAGQDNMFPVAFPVPDKKDFDYMMIDLHLQTVPDDYIKKFRMIDIIFRNNNIQPEYYRSQLRILVKIDHRSQQICQNCLEDAMIMAPFQSIVAISIDYKYNKRTNLDKLPIQTVDFLYAKDIKMFRLNLTEVKQEQQNIFINLDSLSGGNKKIYANKVIMPSDKSKCEFTSDDENKDHEEQLVIKYDDYKSAEYLHIGIWGEQNGFFELHIEFDNKQVKSIILGQHYTNNLDQEEIFNYMLSVWQLNGDYKEANQLEVQLSVKQGYVDFAFNQCTNQECELIQQEDIDQHKNLVYQSQQQIGVQKYTIHNKCGGQSICYYSFAVRGKGIKNKVSVYTNYIGGVIQLLENKPLELHVDPQQDASLYFDYQGTSEKIDKLRFMISSNDALMTVKHGSGCAINKVQDCTITHLGDSLTPVTITRDIMEGGIFLMKIKVLQSTSLIVQVEVYESDKDSQNSGTDQNEQIKYQQMFEGRQYDFSLLNYQSYYFMFQLDLHEDQDVFVDVNPQQYNIKILCKVGNQINDQSYDFITYNSNLIISKQKNPTRYQKKANYYCKVSGSEPIEFQNKQFSVRYYHKDGIRILRENKMELLDIKQQEQVIMSYYVNKQSFYKLVLQTRILNYKAKMVPLDISVNVSPSYSSQTQKQDEWSPIHFKTKQNDQHDNDWNDNVISKKTIQNICKGNQYAQCQFFLKIDNQNDYDVRLMLNVQGQSQELVLEEGHRQYMQLLNTKSQSEMIFFTPTDSNNNVDFFVKNLLNLRFDISIEVLVNMKQKYIQNDQSKSEPLIYLSDKNKIEHSIQLTTDHFSKCKPDCVVAIEVKYSPDQIKQNKYIQQLYGNINDIEIIATSRVSDLVQNKEQVFNLDEGTNKYFRIDITEYDYFKDSISFQVQKLFGNFEFYYTIYQDDEFVYPHRDNSKVKYNYDSDNSIIIIQKEMIKQSIKQNNIDLKKGSKLYMMICFSQIIDNGLYRLTYKKDTDLIDKIHLNNYKQIKLAKQEIRFFKFSKFMYQDKTQILFNKIEGDNFVIKTSICSDSLYGCQEQLKNSLMNQYENSEFNQQSSYEYVIDDKVCKYCQVIVAIQNSGVRDLVGRMLVHQKDQPIVLNSDESYKEKRKSKTTAFYQLQQQLNDYKFTRCKINLLNGKIRVIIDKSHNPNESEKKLMTNKNEHIYFLDSSSSSYINILIDNDIDSQYGWGLNYNPVYVRIDSYEDSQYQISYSGGHEDRESMILYPGVLHHDSFNQSIKDVEKIHKIHTSQFYDDIYINVQFQDGYNIDTNLDIFLALSDVMGYYIDQPNLDYYEVVNKGLTFLQVKVNYEMVRPYNLVEVKFVSKKVCGFNEFSIVANSQRIIEMNYNSRLIIHSENETLQTEIPNEGVLKVKVVDCESPLSMVVSQVQRQTYKSILDNLYQESLINRIYHGYYKVKKGTINIDFRLNDILAQDGKNHSVTSKVETQYMNMKEFRNRDQLDAKNTGLLVEIDDLESEQVDVLLTFETVRCMNCSQHYTIDYQAVISNNRELLEQQSRCIEKNYKNNRSMIMKQHLYYQNLSQPHEVEKDGKLTTRVQVNKQFKKLYILVVGIAYNQQNQLDELYFYDTQEMLLNMIPIKSSGHLKWFLAVSIIILTLFLVWYLRRYQLLKKRLQYEIKEVRNIGLIVGNEGQNSQMVEVQGYDNMVEDKF